MEKITEQLELFEAKFRALQKTNMFYLNRADDRTELKQLTQREFGDKFPLIFVQAGLKDPFFGAAHANIELVDISHDVAVLVKKELGMAIEEQQSEK